MKTDAVIAAARACIGTPFVHQGRRPKTNADKGGIDCLGVLMHVACSEQLVAKDGTPLSALDQQDYTHFPDELALYQRLCMALEAVPCEAVQADSTEFATLHQPPALTQIYWVDALSGSVRPVLTYLFFATYVVVKAAQFNLLLEPALPWQAPLAPAQALVSLWGEEDEAIFAAIISFWFGQRALMKARNLH